MPDIVDIAVGAGSFQTLVTAVQVANLVDALKSPFLLSLHPLTMLCEIAAGNYHNPSAERSPTD